MPTLVEQLVGRFEREGIPCCHWKGAAALERALAGERDLDFLIPADAWERALLALAELGFKPARSRFARDAPGTAHFFGHQPGLERLLHVHLHDRVLMGEDWIPSHTLPFDRALLASPDLAHGVRVPTPALEAVLTVLKHAIRWGSLPDLVTASLRPKDERAELARLLTDETLAAALPLLREHCPAVDEATFRACGAALRAGRFRPERLRLAAAVRRSLRPWANHGRAGRWAAYGRVLLARTRRLLDGDRRDKAPRRGGALIAFVGSDARARAALASETGRWLGQAFAVRVVRARAEGSVPADEIALCEGEPATRVPDLRIEARGRLDPETRARIWAAL